MRFERLLELVNTVAQSGLTDFRYEEGDTRICMSRGGSCGQVGGMLSGTIQDGNTIHPVAMEADNRNVPSGSADSGSADTGSQAVQSAAGKLIASPLVGTFYAAPSEDAQVYVQVGDTVKKGQTLAIVEAMKLMNEIESEYDGIVEEVLVKNGQGVEYGQPLFRIA